MMKAFKYFSFAWLLLAAAPLFVACGDDDEPQTAPANPTDNTGGNSGNTNGNSPGSDTGNTNMADAVVTGGVATLGFTLATVYGYVNHDDPQAILGMGIVYGTESDVAKLAATGKKATASSFDPGTSNRRFSVNITGLSPNTTYYYYAYAGQKTANVIQSFTTKDIDISTGEVINVDENTATAYGKIANNDMREELDGWYYGGIVYGTERNAAKLAATGKKAMASSFGTNDFTVYLEGLTPGTTYYYYAYAGYKGKEKKANEILSFTTKSICPDSNHPHMIDLGLPSGTKWACCNVGASTPEDYGNYYAWGETQPKEVYNLDTYAYYNSNSGYVDIGSDIAGTGYDAATTNWGAPWRMPSLTQIQELLDNCTSTWISRNGVNGRKFTGPNGGTIFLPAAGHRWGSGLDYAGSYGYYWSSTLYEGGPHDAYFLFFSSGDAYWGYGYDRYYGFSVRPVRSN